MPKPLSAWSIICCRSTISRSACLTRTSENGAASTRIVNGTHAPVSETNGDAPCCSMVPAQVAGQVVHALDLAREQGVDLGRVVGEVVDDQFVDEGRTVPVVGEPVELRQLAGDEPVVAERAGAHRPADVEVGREDADRVLGQELVEDGVGLVELRHGSSSDRRSSSCSAPGSWPAPRCRRTPFFGSVTLARLGDMTSSAVRVLPLWNSTPSRSRTGYCVLSPLGVTASATDGSISYCGVPSGNSGS